MLNRIRSFLVWLHEPDHVARFQRYFGILPTASIPDIVRINTMNDNNLSKDNNNSYDVSTSHITRRLSNGGFLEHHERKITWDTNVLDECIEELKHSSNEATTTTKKKNIELDYKITSWFWYYFFQFGAALGNEIFYIGFFPTWAWNVDGTIVPKLSILWAFIMYIGQATKDVLAIPRPRSPPVFKLERRYIEEYGFPSTHAMFATGIPLSFVLLSLQQYDFNLWIGLSCAAITCIWVCLSRVYLGMHTFLDIIAGSIYALVLIYIMLPCVNRIYDFQLNFSLSPLLNFVIGIILMKCYPSLKQWSTARSDTTCILGSAFGLCSATTAMNRIGLSQKPLMPPLYSIFAHYLCICVLRTILGLIILYATRQIVKTIVLRTTTAIYGLNSRNPEMRRLAKVEMPYYYLTYFAIGFNIIFTCPLVFRVIGINHGYSYTEL